MSTPTPMAMQLPLEDSTPDQTVALVLEQAVALGVSDLFICPRDGHISIQGRYLGVMRPIAQVPADMGKRCVSHLKAVAGLDVAERRRPQDGRWLFRLPSGANIDLRISLLPTLHGEDCTIRLLPRESMLLRLENLGLLPPAYNQVVTMLSRPAGLILVTGPTGTGKTTTLYACLKHLAGSERKINTIEDPVEYDIPGVRHSQVNMVLGVGFPELLRSVLRQTPDVIMVGEIRDPVTAETAVRAAVCGHLVLATIHSPVAAGALQTLLGLGVHPQYLASALLGVVAQRLVRTLCPACRKGFQVDPATHGFDEIRPWLRPGDGEMLYAPHGCEVCRGGGYGNRTGIFEVLPTSSAIRGLILRQGTTQQMHHQGVEEGMMTLRQSALLAVARGETSLEEVHRVVPMAGSEVED